MDTTVTLQRILDAFQQYAEAGSDESALAAADAAGEAFADLDAAIRAGHALPEPWRNGGTERGPRLPLGAGTLRRDRDVRHPRP